MKYLKIFSKRRFYTALLTCFVISSCVQDDVLKEVPKGFLSPENVFQNKEGFQSALGNLYVLGRDLRTAQRVPGEGDKAITAMYGSGTDLGWYWDKKLFFGDYTLINSNTTLSIGYWNILFLMIKDANMILSRLEGAPLSDEEALAIEAEARFFRAYAYRHLVYLFGDVPKITEEITEPKLDFVRTPANEILAFMIGDLEFATQYLPVVNPGDGRVAKAAADHILAETYISTGDFDQAIAAASRIIDDGQYQLMTERFGAFSTKPGDVFWDLFRLGNQNGNAGNTESILVWQMEFGVPGGEAPYRFEREWGPLIGNLVDSKGNKAVLPSDTLGRGIAFFRPSVYLETTIWESDYDNDIRNSKYNMQRQFYNNNPASPEFGQVITPRPIDLNRHHFVWVKKAAHPEGHPQGYDTGGRLYSDIYAIRLAETYLLRAEAYLRNSDPISAAADINTVRLRAKATPVDPADVDIDYILDERARELVGEEPRRLTLARMNLLYDRVIRYNPISAPTIQPFNNLLPIPQNQIDRTEGGAEAFPQNPGYK
jgi:hypothetical protein